MGRKEIVNEVDRLLKDAEELYREAIKELEEGKIRNAAEKAWGGVMRATNALILASFQMKPESFRERREKYKELAEKEKYIRRKRLFQDYMAYSRELHIETFYEGHLQPIADTEKRIRETIYYIKNLSPIINKKLAELKCQ